MSTVGTAAALGAGIVVGWVHRRRASLGGGSTACSAERTAVIGMRRGMPVLPRLKNVGATG
jgi:hypothetical protein